jgi:hypothetical protein
MRLLATTLLSRVVTISIVLALILFMATDVPAG